MKKVLILGRTIEEQLKYDEEHTLISKVEKIIGKAPFITYFYDMRSTPGKREPHLNFAELKGDFDDLVKVLLKEKLLSFDLIINDKATLKFMTTDNKFHSLIDDLIGERIITENTKIVLCDITEMNSDINYVNLKEYNNKLLSTSKRIEIKVHFLQKSNIPLTVPESFTTNDIIHMLTQKHIVNAQMEDPTRKFIYAGMDLKDKSLKDNNVGDGSILHLTTRMQNSSKLWTYWKSSFEKHNFTITKRKYGFPLQVPIKVGMFHLISKIQSGGVNKKKSPIKHKPKSRKLLKNK